MSSSGARVEIAPGSRDMFAKMRPFVRKLSFRSSTSGSTRQSRRTSSQVGTSQR